MSKKNRLLLIGLDGATWDVMEPLIDRGCLPNIKQLRDGGMHGVLKSVFPPVTGSAWTSIATGMDPGKTGIFDFLVLQDRKTWKLRTVNSRDLRGKAIWDHLSERNRKVGVVNYPVLYPPYKINGVMVSGLGASEDADIFYPPHLKDELTESIGRHRIYVSYARPRYGNPDRFVRDINQLIDYYYKLADALIDESYDFFTFVISATDFLCHYGWHWFTDEKKQFNKGFNDIWTRIDDLIGFMIKKWGDDNVMVISDHGMGELKEVFFVNQWLQNQGYLFFKQQNSSLTPAFVSRKLKTMLRDGFILCAKTFPLLADRIFVELTRKKKLSRHGIAGKIDLNRSSAFALEHSGLGHIYINSNGAPQGYDEIRNEISTALKNFIEASGRAIDIFSKYELYGPDANKNLPDIIFMIDENRTEVIPTLYKRRLFAKPLTLNRTGSHRLSGIYVISPEAAKFDDLLPEKPGLADIFGAVCRIMGEPFENISHSNNKKEETNSLHMLEDENIVKHLTDLGYM